MGQATRKLRKQIFGLPLKEICRQLELQDKVRSVHPETLTVVWTDGSHTHLDNTFKDGVTRSTEALYAEMLCELKGLSQ